MLIFLAAQVVIIPQPCAPTDYACRMSQAAQSVPDYNDGEISRATASEARSRAEIARAEARRVAVRERVGSLIADGECDEARKQALRAGDFTLAQEAVRLCAPNVP